MKLRYVDLLSDDQYQALSATKADHRMFIAGVCCLLSMMALSLGGVIL